MNGAQYQFTPIDSYEDLADRNDAKLRLRLTSLEFRL